MEKLALDSILDVTLRDGGYLNGWQFSSAEIDSTLRFLHQQGLRKVEIGFLRTPERTTSVINGCPADFLADISARYPNMQLVGMLNPAEDNWEEAVTGKLPCLSLIRMPCTPELVDTALTIAAQLHKQSDTIKVSLNLICISAYAHEEIACLLQKIGASKYVDRVYFADSRGALFPHEIAPLIALGKQYCAQPLGFHAHDTQGNAIENSDRAFASGCDWIDVSLNGFGLAGGNTSLERYLMHHALMPQGTDLLSETQRFLSHPTEEERQLYLMLARKNIDPIWAEQLMAIYPNNLSGLVDSLPRNHYPTLASVLEAFTERNLTHA